MKSTRKVVMFLFALFVYSCTSTKEPKNAVDISSQPKVDISIQRYEKDLFSVNKNNLKNELLRLQKKYRFFLDGDLAEDKNVKQIQRYIEDDLIVGIYKETAKQYPSLKAIEDQISDAFTYMKYYYPNQKIPVVYTYVSGLDYEFPVKFADSVLIIALDMYLGKDCKFYQQLGVPLYMSLNWTRDHIVFDCMKEIAFTKIKADPSNKSFINELISQGKILYFIDAMTPNLADNLKIGYPQDKLDWCKKNEANIWSFILENKLLYSTDQQHISKFFTDGPFTSSFSKQSPGKMGYWVGWQIIKSYMKKNPDVHLARLMEDTNAQEILTKSKYKPQK
ncbi:MAG: hypothetical protein WCH34_17295 [Bacteroidota bacterium]